MKRTALKHEAQDRLIASFEVAFLGLSDDPFLSDDERKALEAEMIRQQNRVLRFFGYVVNEEE